MTDAPQAAPLHAAIAQLRHNWGWFVALGALTILAGLIALGNLMIGTLVSVLFIGAMMTIAGVAHIIHAFQVRGWSEFLLWLVTGLLYTAAGLMVAYNPLLGASVVTLFIGIMLIASGIVRIVVAFRMRGMPAWGWMLVAGIVTLLLGLTIAAHWPFNSVWVLGLFLGIDLLFTGFALVSWGLRLKPAA
jgi:uncharacterized membrane protein HdeD (DUF308 family)